MSDTFVFDAEANRAFVKLHFDGKDPVDELFTVTNPYTKEPMIFILDFAVRSYYSIFADSIHSLCDTTTRNCYYGVTQV